MTTANFSGALVGGADFDNSTNRGFTKEQLYSTASYQQRNLQGIKLSSNGLNGWDFSGQNLSDAIFDRSTLTDANVFGAKLTSASLLGSTLMNADFSGANLTRADLSSAILTNANLSGGNLTSASFNASTLTNANFSGAFIGGAVFSFGTIGGFTKEQLYSTASYQRNNLQGISLREYDLTGWDFSGQNVSNADFDLSTLTNTNFSGAVVDGASFPGATNAGFTKEHLYSTTSYQQKNLRGIRLSGNDLTGWDFNGQNLRDAVFDHSRMTNANFSDALIEGTDFVGVTAFGFTKEQLYATASYQARDLKGVGLVGNALNGWDFSGQNLTNADLRATLTNANFSGADLRGARLAATSGAFTANMIHPDGTINGLSLTPGQSLIVRDYDGRTDFPPPPITVKQDFFLEVGEMLELVFEADEWNSLIMFDPGIDVTRRGTLRLDFADDVNLASQVGRTLRVFNWTGVSPIGAFQISSPYVWETSNMYTTGEVTLIAVPEPSTDAFLTLAALAVVARCRRCCRCQELAFARR